MIKTNNIKQGYLIEEKQYLECERWWILACLMYIGGFFGGFTYSVRGGVFCNAQTGNFVLLAIAFGNSDFTKIGYLLISITAYFLGTVISERIAGSIRRLHIIRWDTLLILIEIIVVIILGFIPDSAPFQITQIAINFICSMQYNTFRQADGIPMATTVCTNHVRQTGIFFTKAFHHKDLEALKRMGFHIGMIVLFVLGGTSAALICKIVSGKGIWLTLIPLIIILCDLLYADLKSERNLMDKIPRGH